jgi:hypothetical protein
MRAFAIATACLLISGCAYYLTPRPPVMERKLGRPGHESIGALATAADYRMVYVGINPKTKMCAEPPPDAAGQFAAQFAAAMKGLSLQDQKLSAETQASMALSMKQLFRRSQGVQFYRDGVFALCNMHLNGQIDGPQYVASEQALREAAAALIYREIPFLSKISYDPIAAPGLPPPVTDLGKDDEPPAPDKPDTPDAPDTPDTPDAPG